MPNRHLKRQSYHQDDITEELMGVFQYYKSFRQQYEEKAIEHYKTYRGYMEDRQSGEDDEDMANLNIPKVYQALDTIRSQIVTSFFGKRPFIEFMPMPETGSMRSYVVGEDKAEIAAAIVDEQLEKCGILKEFYEFVTSFLIFPAAILGVGWRFEQEIVRRKTQVPEIVQGLYTGRRVWDIVEAPEVVYDDNEVVNIDFFNFWADPEAKSISDARGVFHREYVTLEELANRYERFQDLNEGILYDIDLEKLERTDARRHDDDRSRRMREVDISMEGQDPYGKSEDSGLKGQSEIELLHYWEDDRHSIIINRDTCMYDGPNPYWRHGSIPFAMASYEELPNELYGMSAVEIVHEIQEEINTMHNQRIDNATMVLNNMWLRNRNSNIDESDLVSRPNGVIDVDDMNNIQKLEQGDIPESAFVNEEMLHAEIESSLPTPPILRGVESTGRQTATEAQNLQRNALGRYEAKLRILEEQVINEMARMMDLNNQQFITDARVVRYDEEDLAKWQEVQPGDLIGEFDYSPAKTTIDEAANEEIRREQLTEALGFLLQADVPFINYRKFIAEWLETFDFKNPEKFFLTDEEMMQIREKYLSQLSGLEGLAPQQGSLGSSAGTGNLGAKKLESPNRHAGGMQADGTPQPQPGQRGGANYTRFTNQAQAGN